MLNNVPRYSLFSLLLLQFFVYNRLLLNSIKNPSLLLFILSNFSMLEWVKCSKCKNRILASPLLLLFSHQGHGVSFPLTWSFFLRWGSLIVVSYVYSDSNFPLLQWGIRRLLHILYDCPHFSVVRRVFRVTSETPVLFHSLMKFARIFILRLWKEEQPL